LLPRTLLVLLSLAWPGQAQSPGVEGSAPGLQLQEGWSLAVPPPGHSDLDLGQLQWRTFTLVPIQVPYRDGTRPALSIQVSNRVTIKGLSLQIGAHAFVASEPQGGRFNAPHGASVSGGFTRDLRLYLGTGIAF